MTKKNTNKQFVHYKKWTTNEGFTFLAESKEDAIRSEEHTSELQSRLHLVCRLLLEKKKTKKHKKKKKKNKNKKEKESRLKHQ